MLIRSLDALTPRMQSLAAKALEAMQTDSKLKSLGVADILVNESFRELSTQLIYWMRGRMADPADVQAAYKRAWGWQPSPEECAKKITWTLESKHMTGNAIDLVPSKTGKDFWWTAPEAVWQRMGEIGKQCGLKWGGDWKTKDSPHYEI